MNKKLKFKDGDLNQNVNDKRRNLAKAGVTLPFLMSFSRPLWAADECQPSDLQSGNLSVRPGKPNCFGKGMTANFFATSADIYWIGYSRSTKFNDVFGIKIKIMQSGSDNLDPTFQQVLEATADSIKAKTTPSAYPNIGAEAKQAIAALLNVGLSPHYGKTAPTDVPFEISDVISAFDNQTAVATFSPFET